MKKLITLVTLALTLTTFSNDKGKPLAPETVDMVTKAFLRINLTASIIKKGIGENKRDITYRMVCKNVGVAEGAIDGANINEVFAHDNPYAVTQFVDMKVDGCHYSSSSKEFNKEELLERLGEISDDLKKIIEDNQ